MTSIKTEQDLSRQPRLKDQHTPLTGSLLGFILCLNSSGVNAASDSLQRLKNFSLDDLVAVEVSVVGKKLQKITDVPAAVYSLSEEQIKASGASNIPDLLRLVPGLHVAQIDANKWVVSSRGFSNRITNKLLVMIDGRSIYSPLFGGVTWDQQNLMIEDIERIEVVRGPGGAAWGANAVNGVINIISKHSRNTQGGLLSTLVGSEKNIVSLRQGGQLSESAWYRVYAKYRQHDESVFLDGHDATDQWHDTQLGFRVDWQLGNDEQLTLQGDMYEGDMSERITIPSLATATFTDIREDNIDVSGANLLARWSKDNEQGGSSELQVYIDHTERDQWVLDERRDIFDADYQYRLAPIGQHALTFGTGYRYTRDSLPSGDINIGQVRIYTPENRSDHLYSAFIQDDITLQDKHWWLTLGTKLEHNQYTGLEFQPSARLRWRPVEGQLLWGSISRSIRTPSRAESDGFILLDVISAGPPPVALLLQGNTDLDSESLIAYELGYRNQVNSRFIFDLAIFYQDYDKLISFESNGVGAPPIPSPIAALSQTLTLDNELEGASYGLELSAIWQPSPVLSLQANYSYLELDISPTNAGTDISSEQQEDLSPKHQLNIVSSWKIQEKLKLNMTARYVGALSGSDTDAYIELDSSVQWQVSDSINISLVARNLLHDEHKEASPAVYPTAATQIEREVFVKLDWLF